MNANDFRGRADELFAAATSFRDALDSSLPPDDHRSGYRDVAFMKLKECVEYALKALFTSASDSMFGPPKEKP